MALIVDIEKKLPGFHLKVSFQCEQNTLGLLGSSGSGKSMTLRCIAGLETPTKGHIALDGNVLFDSAKGINLPPQTRQVGFLFQNFALFPHLTVKENIRLGIRGLNKDKQRSRMEDLIALVQLAGFEDRYPLQLSGGQQQRAALARALAQQPHILLLDEPFSASDSHLRGELEQQLSSILKVFPYPSIFVTHNLDEAYRLCPDLLVLHNGRAVAFGTREDIFTRPPAYEAARLTACQNISRAQKVGDYEIEPADWACRLRVTQLVPDNITHAGIRAHHISFTEKQDEVNIFPYSLKDLTHAPDHVLLSIGLGKNDKNKDKQSELKVKIHLANNLLRQQGIWPPFIKLPAEEVFLMTDISDS